MKIKPLASALIILFTLSTAIPVRSQFRDYRDATIIKSNGDSIVGKINFKLNFHKSKTVLVKAQGSREDISISALKRIILSSGEVYTVIRQDDQDRKETLAKTLIDGRVGLHKAGDVYYLSKDTSIYKLDNEPTTINQGGTKITAPSKKYLLALNAAFLDCQTLDYGPLANDLSLKPLTNLIAQYSACKNMPITNVARKASIGLGFSVAPSQLKANTSLNDESGYNSGSGTSYTLSFLLDIGASNRIKMRVDLNYLKSEISGSFTTTRTVDAPGANLETRKQYTSFSTEFNGLRIPIGIQYYFFNNKSSLYLAGGLVFSAGKYDNWDTEGYLIYEEDETKIYVPADNESYNVKQDPIGGFWGAIGGDIRLNNLLKLNIEVRGIKGFSNFSAYEKKESIKIYEFSPSVGLTFKIR